MWNGKERDKSKKRRFEVIESDMNMTEVCEEDAKDLSKRMLRTRMTNPNGLGERPKKEKSKAMVTVLKRII